MLSFDPSQKIGHAIPATVPGAGSSAADTSSDSGKGFFANLLDVINPLQHLPVVSTIYRAITGDHIGTFEKIAGDTLYGGVWGAVASVGDSIFQAVTGKDFGDTVLGLFTGHHSQTAAAAAAPTAQAQPLQADPSVDLAALSRSLTAKGIDPDLAQRAMFAYQKGMALPNSAAIN